MPDENLTPTMVYLPAWVRAILQVRAARNERSLSWEARKELERALAGERDV